MITTEELTIEYIPIELLTKNTWNSNVMSAENEAKLAESLKKQKLFDAIIARQLEDGSYQILGGEHRTKVAQKLGMKKMPVIVHRNISDNEAKEMSLTHNARYGADDSLKLSELIGSLDSSESLADFLPYSGIEIETLLSATKFDFESLDILDEDDKEEVFQDTSKPSKTHTVMRFKVSLEDASEIEDLIKKTMKENGFTDSDQLTNAGDSLAFLLLNR